MKKKEKELKTSKPAHPINTSNTSKKQPTNNKTLTLDILRQNFKNSYQMNQCRVLTLQQALIIKVPTELEQDKVNQAITKIKSNSEAISQMTPTERREKKVQLWKI